jgi:murein DD-endopeptidase MepM/ murein hydrolase activator NlpD
MPRPFRPACSVLLHVILAVLISGCEFVQDEVSASPPGPRVLYIQLPTGNDALLHGDEPAFYMGLDQTIPGLRPEGWMGGRYGFVRNQAVTPIGRVFTRVHQGIDIRPLGRDANDNPTDSIRAISDGRVAFVNAQPGSSSYGIYLVVEHDWDRSPVYSLYAHLASVSVDSSAAVARGDSMGRMGFTGAGLHRGRAHLHLEIALLVNRNYEEWHDAFFGTPNHQGVFFGRNLMGVDPAALFLALEEEPDLSFSEFVRRQPVAYRLAIPGDRPLDILERYPWLAAEGVSPRDTRATGSWVVSFTREGVPIEVARQDGHVAGPEVVYVTDEVQRRYLSTGGVLVRTDLGYQLTRAGRAYAALLATTPGNVPPWF